MPVSFQWGPAFCFVSKGLLWQRLAADRATRPFHTFLGLKQVSPLPCPEGRPISPGPAEDRFRNLNESHINPNQPVVMPTSKTRTADLEAIATGEAKPKRVRRPAAPKTTKPDGSGTATVEAAKKAPRRRTPATKVGAATEPPAITHESVPVAVSTEDISIRAYFIAENRHALGLSGDSESDWLEAERQLRAEAAGIAASLREK
jgi:hypothetical protein